LNPSLHDDDSSVEQEGPVDKPPIRADFALGSTESLGKLASVEFTNSVLHVREQVASKKKQQPSWAWFFLMTFILASVAFLLLLATTSIPSIDLGKFSLHEV